MPRFIAAASTRRPSRLLIAAIASVSLFAAAYLFDPGLRAATPTNELQAQRRAQQLEKLTLKKQAIAGRALFAKTWHPRKVHNGRGDGLGPLFNERSCAACHKLGALGGAGPNQNNVQLIGIDTQKRDSNDTKINFEAQRKFVLPTATGDVFLLHRFGLDPGYKKWREQRLSFANRAADEQNDRARLIDIFGRQAVQDMSKNTLSNHIGSLVTFFKEERNTTALFGAGLIDAVPEALLEQTAAAQALGIRGRVPRTPDGLVGRFGWKGESSSLNEFNEVACAAELGLQTAKIRQAVSPSPELLNPKSATKKSAVVVSAPPAVAKANLAPATQLAATLQEAAIAVAVPEVDISDDEILNLTAFVASLPAPVQIVEPHKAAHIAAGAMHFRAVGCADCHQPDLGEMKGIYSDLLLHTVGTESKVPGYYGIGTRPVSRSSTRDDLKKRRELRTADPQEFRTPPLWGVADSAPYLHDGRAPTLEAAIMMHGDQARQSVMNYNNLAWDEKPQLILFLMSLRAPSLGK